MRQKEAKLGSDAFAEPHLLDSSDIDAKERERLRTDRILSKLESGFTTMEEAC